ncbi:hypothetical protein Taro_039148 [Colocasia esculenta]|uniref:Uncharacterized protein n=1 Tax=Colocasia esculenta TaxID=4460 RepID=A0A843WEW6_COLES|nr:hypothetical protein [Colocasia esculenta]
MRGEAGDRGSLEKGAWTKEFSSRFRLQLRVLLGFDKRPAYITQLAPMDIQTYPEMVRKSQLLEDATDLTDRIKGRMVKKELTSGAPSRPAYSKKRPLSESDYDHTYEDGTEGDAQE